MSREWKLRVASLVRRAASLLALVLVLAACSSTTWLVDWQRQDARAKPIESMLIIGADHPSEQVTLYEVAVAKALTERGVRTGMRHEVLGDLELTDEQVASYAKKERFDAVLVTKLAAKEVAYETIEGSQTSTDSFTGARMTRAGSGHSQLVGQIQLETRLFDMRTSRPERRLVWRGVLELRDVTSAKEARDTKIEETLAMLELYGWL